VALVFLGTDFHDSPLTDLELFDSQSSRVLSALSAENPVVDGVVILSTCNRFEVYLDSSSPRDGMNFAIATIAREMSTESSEIRSTLTTLAGSDVAHHLFSVSSGLESMIVGEEEISGQVKRALIASHTRGHSSKALNHLFQHAASVTKLVSSATGLGSTGRSVITAALDLAQHQVGDLPGKAVLLIGTGAYSRVVTAALRRRGVEQIFVYSRSGRAEKFSSTHGTTPVSHAELVDLMSSVDLVVSASGTPGLAVSEDLARAVSRQRSGRRDLVFIDVSLSRDIAREIVDIPGLSVIDLESVKTHAPREYVESMDAAQAIVDAAVVDFHTSMTSRAVDPAISALRAHVRGHIEREIESVRRKSGDVAAIEVQKSLRRVTNSLFHGPSERGRQLTADGNHASYVDAIRLLFDIEVSDSV
jgi:glutamyl-tRNA reductase